MTSKVRTGIACVMMCAGLLNFARATNLVPANPAIASPIPASPAAVQNPELRKPALPVPASFVAPTAEEDVGLAPVAGKENSTPVEIPVKPDATPVPVQDGNYALQLGYWQADWSWDGKNNKSDLGSAPLFLVGLTAVQNRLSAGIRTVHSLGN